MEIFFWDGKPGTAPGTEADEYLVWDCDAARPLPGWYYSAGLEYDPQGPYATRDDALRASEQPTER